MGFKNTKVVLKAKSVSCVSAGEAARREEADETTKTTTTTKRQKKTTRTNTTSSTSILYMTKTFVSFSIILTTVLMLHVVDAKIGNYYLVSKYFFLFLTFIFVEKRTHTHKKQHCGRHNVSCLGFENEKLK